MADRQPPDDAAARDLRRAFAAGEVDAVAAALVAPGPSLADALPTCGPDDPFAFALLARAIRYRDEAEVEQAVRLLRVLRRLQPDAPRPAVELLLIDLQVRPDPTSFAAGLSGLPDGLRADARVCVLEGVSALQRGDPEAAAVALARTPAAALAHEPFFAAMWFDLLLDRLRRVGAALDTLMASASAGERAAAFAAALAPAVRSALMHVARPETVSERLLALVLRGPPCAFEVAEAAVLSLPRAGFLKARAQGLGFLAAFRRTDALARFADLHLPDPEMERHPYVLRVVQGAPLLMTGALARLTGPLDAPTRAALRARVEAGPDDPYAHTARKVLARDDARAARPPDPSLRALPRTSSAAPSPSPSPSPHVFVGLFGQLRFPERLLPALHARLAADLEALGGPVSFGLATWTQQGRRGLSPGDAAFYVYQRLPHEIAAATAPLMCATVGDLARHLPRVVAQAVADPAAGLPEVSPGFLREACGWTDPAAIVADASYLQADWPALEAGLGDVPFVKNQGRMWNRLAALRPLLQDAETSLGTPVDAVVLLRADLDITGGGFARTVGDLLAAGPRNGVRTDEDGPVALIDGVGDRIFVTTRDAAERVFAARDVLQAIARGEDAVDPAYRREVPGGHVFPASLLFEQGVEMGVLGRSDVEFEIYRGRLSLAQLADALQADHQAAPAGALREALAGLLSRARLDSGPAAAAKVAPAAAR